MGVVCSEWYRGQGNWGHGVREGENHWGSVDQELPGAFG